MTGAKEMAREMHVGEGRSMGLLASAERGGGEPDEGPARLYEKGEFWREENLKFSEPWYRLRKAARIIGGLVGTRECSVLDVGCGPAALRDLLPPNVRYYGVDIAIQNPAPYLRQADILETPIGFDEKRFDFVIASGLFEYVGEFQSQKFAEIGRVLNQEGMFIVSYTNFSHRKTEVYNRINNLQSICKFRGDLEKHFRVHRVIPASYNWKHRQPSRSLVQKMNLGFNLNVPWLGRVLAVEYFFICSAP